MKRFIDERVSREHRFSLGRDDRTGDHYLSIPVANRKVDYEEYYRLDVEQYHRYLLDEAAAAAFAEECRRRAHDDRLILPPGSDRGTAI